MLDWTASPMAFIRGGSVSSQDHEQVAIHPLPEAQREEILSKAGECLFNRTAKDGCAVGVAQAFV